MQLFHIYSIIKPVNIVRKGTLIRRLLLQLQKIPFRLEPQSRIPPAVPVYDEGIPRVPRRILQPYLAFLGEKLHRLFLVDFLQELLHIVLVSRHRTKPFVSRQILPVMPRKHLFETGIIKERNRLRPVASRQIRKVKKVSDFPET